MRIEILVDGSEEPQIYPINKTKLTLGSGETCDVVISSDNISRKHLVIVAEGDSYFVIDQGSTNGSYINEERLVPGRRTEFTSFFPVRLGDHVLITLLSDEDVTAKSNAPLIPLYSKEEKNLESGSPRSGVETTKMISLSDLKKAKTSNLQAKRQEAIKRKSPSSAAKATPVRTKRAKENRRFKMLASLMFIGVIGVGYYNFKYKEEEVPVVRMGDLVKIDPKAQAPEQTQNPPAEEIRLIPENELLEKSRYTQMLGDLKCITDIEKYFCEKIPNANGVYGAVQLGTTVHILVNGTPYLEEARRTLTAPQDPALDSFYQNNVIRTAVMAYFLKGIPADLDYEKIKDLKIAVGLFENHDGVNVISAVGAIYPERLQKFKTLVTQENINNVAKIGDGALVFTKEYYRAY